MTEEGGKARSLANLQPVTTTEEAREKGRKGGFASGESKRRKRTMKEDLDILLNLTIRVGEEFSVDDIQSFAELNGKNITVSQAMLLKQIGIALSGSKESTKAFEVIRDTSGQKPADSLNVQGNVNNPMEGLTTEELRALADVKPKRKRGRPKKGETK